MRLEDALGLRFGGKDALEARLGGQVVWTAEDSVAGTVYNEDFSGYALGDTTVAGFTSRWGAISREIVDVNGERALRLQAVDNSTRCAFTYNAVDTDPERENASIFMTVLTTADSGSDISVIRMISRVAGAAGAETGLAGGTALGGDIRIDQYSDGTYSALSSAPFAHNLIRMNSLMRLQGSTITLKAWVDGDPEPAEPQVVTTAAVAGAGHVGLFVFNSRPVDIVFLSIATGEAEPLREPAT